MTDTNPRVRARKVEQSFKLGDGLYLLGSLEKGVTVYRQQVRAHNLIWALTKLTKHPELSKLNIAIVGGGISGLTVAACALVNFPNARVSIFERSLDLCSLQQGCDTRWLHPHIYDWPELDSRAPSASLPVLDWTEGRASDVARQILQGFSRYVNSGRTPGRLRVFIGVDHLRISAQKREIEWIGKSGIWEGEFVRAGYATGESQRFDRIILTLGFGMESDDPNCRTLSYWRNEMYGQPTLDGSAQSYVISGYGDGALIDLCRLTIERFRQDQIIYDIFGEDPSEPERHFRPIARKASRNMNVFPDLKRIDNTLLSNPLKLLSRRIRKDTKVFLHLSGKPSGNTALPDVFGGKSSFANQLLLYLLFRCGAFVPRFDTLSNVINENAIPTENVICRYGPQAMEHIRRVFVKPSEIDITLQRISRRQAQSTRIEWEPAAFPEP